MRRGQGRGVGGTTNPGAEERPNAGLRKESWVTAKDLSTSHAALLRDAMAGRANRRELIRRAAALGLSAPAIAGLLTAYRPARAAAQEPAAGPAPR